jgi:hypothetical protein
MLCTQINKDTKLKKGLKIGGKPVPVPVLVLPKLAFQDQYSHLCSHHIASGSEDLACKNIFLVKFALLFAIPVFCTVVLFKIGLLYPGFNLKTKGKRKGSN